MRAASSLLLLLIVLFPTIPEPCYTANANSTPTPHLESWLAQRACSVVDTASPADAPDAGCPGLDALVNRAREAVSGATTPPETIERLNRFFFQSEKFQVTYDLSSADHLLPGPAMTGPVGRAIVSGWPRSTSSWPRS